MSTLLSVGGFAAFEMASGSKLAAPCDWADGDEDLTFTQDASLPGQFPQQEELRARELVANLEEVGNSKLRRLLAYNKSRN